MEGARAPLSSDLVEAINRDHLIETELEPADLLFLFGTRSGVPEFLLEISSLWKRGFFKWVVVSGGLTPGCDRTEAEIISAGMAADGVPAAIVLTEHHATNTGENVIFSLPIIEAQIGLARVSSLIALGKHCTSIRYLMTLQKHWPSVRKMLVAVNDYGHPADEWHQHLASRARVLSEWEKIEPYRRAGFIADWPAAASHTDLDDPLGNRLRTS